MNDTPQNAPAKKVFKTSLWVSSTYFAEGLPYMIVRFMSQVFFTDLGVREALLGFLNFLGIPWNLKFLWAPLLDIFSTKRRWMLIIQFLITLITFIIAILAGIHASPAPPVILQAAAFLFIGLAFIAATNDIAIDAYYLEGLTDKKDQAAYSGLRVMAYRVAVIYARSVLIAVAGIANWFWGFTAGAFTMLVFLLLHNFLLPRFEAEKQKMAGFMEAARGFRDSFLSYLKQEKVVFVLIFVATYKLGDEILFSMNTPFLMRELAVTKTQLSWIAGIVGSVCAICGAMIGAWWIKTAGFKKAVWPITILMNFNIWAYVLLSEFRPQAVTAKALAFIAAVHGYENIAAGLGTAALMVYLMRLCSQKYKAAHFAIGTAIMTLGSTFIGGFSGIIVEMVGYTKLFILGFVAAVPSMLLLFFIPMHENDK
jgi:PAT family beta-lactamase induction signal transducer AmpG